MANWDTPGLTYDSGVRFDEPAVPPLRRPRTMARVKLNIAKQSVAALLQSANNIKTALTGNTHFPALNPPLIDLDADITDLTNWTNTHQASANTTREHLAM